MVADGLVIGSAGNVSVRLDAHRFVVSAAGVLYGELEPADHPVVDVADRRVGGPRRPTSELALHLGVMRDARGRRRRAHPLPLRRGVLRRPPRQD